MQNISCHVIFSLEKDYQTMTSGWQDSTYFRRCDRERVSKPVTSLKKNWGGYRRTTYIAKQELQFDDFGLRSPVIQKIDNNKK